MKHIFHTVTPLLASKLNATAGAGHRIPLSSIDTQIASTIAYALDITSTLYNDTNKYNAVHFADTLNALASQFGPILHDGKTFISFASTTQNATGDYQDATKLVTAIVSDHPTVPVHCTTAHILEVTAITRDPILTGIAEGMGISEGMDISNPKRTLSDTKW